MTLFSTPTEEKLLNFVSDINAPRTENVFKKFEIVEIVFPKMVLLTISLNLNNNWDF